MTDASRKPVLTGGCQCGAVRYALFAPPERVHLCHCRMCQKAMGGPFAPLAPIGKADFAWTRGSPGVFASSSIAERFFCSKCGTPLGFRYVDAPSTSVTIGSLDRPQDVAPVFECGEESRIGWIDKLGAVARHTTEALVPRERLAQCVAYQHPDHETPADWQPPGRKRP